MNVYLFSDTINLASGEWYPYSSYHDDGSGIVSMIVCEAIKEVGDDCNLSFVGFKNAYIETLNQTFDATFPYFIDSLRKNEMLYSEPLFTVKNVLFYNKNSLADATHLYSKNIGVVEGYAYKNIDVSKFDKKTIFQSELVAFESLLLGKIDLLPSSLLVGVHILKKYFNDFHTNVDFFTNNNFISYDTLHLITNKKNLDFIVRFNKGLSLLKKSEKYQEILIKNQNILSTELSNVVRLTNNTETFPMVVATTAMKSKHKIIIPRGTKAIVLEWSPHFLNEGDIKVYDEMFKKTKVKIANGPLKGKIVFVENMFIEID